MTVFLKILRQLVLVIVTALAVAAMVWISTRGGGGVKAEYVDRPAADAAAFKALVAVEELRPERVEILDTYSGMIRPWERYTLGFEIAGRVKSLGTTESGEPLDDGDRVEAGQMLARLDDRTLEAQKREATARLKQASLDMERVTRLRERNLGAVTDTELLERETAQTLATAQLAMAVKNVEDSALVAPVDSYISRRMINAGESVNPHQAMFELVETDKVLLVLGVPESQIMAVEARQREVERNRKLQREAMIDDEDLEFRAYVELVGRDRFGKAWPKRTGTVHQVSKTADDKTGLFEVEVVLENRDGLLKPGMVAKADLVTSRVEAYRVPVSSVVFRGNQAYLFTVREEPADVSVMFFPVGKGSAYRAQRVQLPRWIEQGADVIVPETPEGRMVAVVRGQHRLVDGQPVRIVPSPEDPVAAGDVKVAVPSPTVSAKPNDETM